MPESSTAPPPIAHRSTVFARLSQANGGGGGGGGSFDLGAAQANRTGAGGAGDGGGAGVRAVGTAGGGVEFEEKWDVALSSLVDLRTLFR